MESVSILEEAEMLGKIIENSEPAQEYQRVSDALKNDKTAQSLISEFQHIKDKYEDVQRFGRYHPDFKEISASMRTAKRSMDMNDAVAAFRKAETNLQALLDEISTELGKAISQHIKVPSGNPFFETGSSCGGGCGSGGSCGCAS
ncbi:YlbF family regulator [Metabacillus sp. GX 13764]|uniref:YlbF family regulator n=1 Tax=Metabacillus kandeliae TaxID=2900151 RepID=UPI001E3137F5|nr:YlbF family regulator [Metabacillus kandeliae]MCD7033920.1 YlbF family regulator [Metabacillus kandeliae]